MAGTLQLDFLQPQSNTGLYILSPTGSTMASINTAGIYSATGGQMFNASGNFVNPVISSGSSLTLQTANTTAITVDTSQNVTFTGYINAPNTFGFRNRLINGAMVIDQRNAGASVTVTSDGSYQLDRWQSVLTAGSKFSIQQSTTTATGFKNSTLLTSLSAYSLSGSDRFGWQQQVEGLNTYDLGWGAAGASAVTLSFWVRSSLTGTMGGCVTNSAQNRSYPFSFTINSANTFEYKTITIAGDTSGTWLTTNGTGLVVRFCLGAVSSYRNTAGAWAAGDYWGPTGGIDFVSTNGATFYITGVQLEKGSTATSFDYRPYGTELALCQRYFFKTNDVGSATGANGAPIVGIGSSTNGCIVCGFRYPVQLRTTPTIVFTSFNGTSGVWSNSANNADTAAATVNGSAASGLQQVTVTGLTTGQPYYVYATANSEL